MKASPPGMRLQFSDIVVLRIKGDILRSIILDHTCSAKHRNGRKMAKKAEFAAKNQETDVSNMPDDAPSSTRIETDITRVPDDSFSSIETDTDVPKVPYDGPSSAKTETDITSVPYDASSPSVLVERPSESDLKQQSYSWRHNIWGQEVRVSLSHDGEYATAVAIVQADVDIVSRGLGKSKPKKMAEKAHHEVKRIKYGNTEQ